jgi:hypothetical protein
MRKVWLVPVMTLAVMLAGCGDGPTATVKDRTSINIEIRVGGSDIVASGPIQIREQGCPELGASFVELTSRNVDVASWTSSNPAVAAVTKMGPRKARVDGVAPGTAFITAVGVNGEQMEPETVVVLPCPIPPTPPPPPPPTPTFTVTISPPIVPTICPLSFQLYGQVSRSDGQQVSQQLTWEFVSGPGSVTSSGVYTGGTSGSVTVRARSVAHPEATALITFTVNCPPPAQLTISPLNPTISLGTVGGICVAEMQFSAMFGGQAVTPQWQTSGATVTSGGLFRATTAGTYTVFATHQGQTVSTTVTVTGSCLPPAQIVVTVAPKTETCPFPGQATFGASVTGTTAGQSTAVTWSVSNQSVATIATVTSNSVVLNCLQAGQVTVTATSVADPTKFDTGTLTVQSPPPAQCPTISQIDYSPKGGNIGVNENRLITLDQVANWPTNCDMIWTSDAPSRIQVNGADNVRQVAGEWFYSGQRASIRGIFAGSAVICGHVIQIGADGKWTRTGVVRCYTWTVPAASANTAGYATAAEFPQLKYMNLDYVQQTPMEDWK